MSAQRNAGRISLLTGTLSLETSHDLIIRNYSHDWLFLDEISGGLHASEEINEERGIKNHVLTLTDFLVFAETSSSSFIMELSRSAPKYVDMSVVFRSSSRAITSLKLSPSSDFSELGIFHHE